MKRVCAWCQRDLGEVAGTSVEEQDVVSHGICEGCVSKVMANSRQGLRELLEQIPSPVFLIDADGRARSANQRALDFVGKSFVDIEAKLGGEVIECAYSYLEGGCGQTVHCAACTIRNTVMATAETGQAKEKVKAHQLIQTSQGDRLAEIFLSTEKIADWVFLRIDGMTFMN